MKVGGAKSQVNKETYRLLELLITSSRGTVWHCKMGQTKTLVWILSKMNNYLYAYFPFFDYRLWK